MGKVAGDRGHTIGLWNYTKVVILFLLSLAPVPYNPRRYG